MFKNLNAHALGIRATISEIVELALVAGFQGTDFNIPELAALTDSHGMEYGRSIFESANLRTGVWPLPTNWREQDEAFERELTRLNSYAALAKELGATRTMTTLDPASDERPLHENFEWHRERFGRIAEVLREHECSLGLEYIGAKAARAGKQFEFIHTLDATLQLSDAIGTGNVGVLLDSWQWYTSQGTLDDIRALKPEQVVAVHVSDAQPDVAAEEQAITERTLPGTTGVIDLAGFLKALVDVGYDGPVTPDPSSRRQRQMSREQAARAAGDALQKLWRQVGLAMDEEAEEESAVESAASPSDA